jgi:hypothetical protein
MPEEIKSSVKNADISDLLTDEERRRLLANLHRTLVWVGVKEPEEYKVEKEMIKDEMLKYGLTESDQPPEVHPDKGVIDVHHLIWRLINEKEITDKERVQIDELIDLLQRKEHQEEEGIKTTRLTHEQAKEVYNETAGCIRALIDLKDLLMKREHSDQEKTAIRKKVDDAKKWNEFAERFKEDR